MIDEFKNELDAIREQELKLRRQKAEILKDQPWYKRPQNIIAIFSVVLPILITIGIKVFEKDTKELAVYYSQPENLILEEAISEDKLSVFYDSSEVKNISQIRIKIVNTGNQCLKSKDFSDGPILFRLNNNRIGTESMKQIPFLLDVLKINDAEQQNSKINIISSYEKSSFSYLPSLLNSGDAVELMVLLSNRPEITLESFGKIENGILKKVEDIENFEKQTKFSSLIQGVQSFFGRKWLAIVFLIILLVVTGFVNFGFGVLATEEGNTEPIEIAYVLTGAMILVNISILILLISVIVI